MFDFIGELIGQLVFGAIGEFFRVTRWMSIIYLTVAIGIGVLVGNQIGYLLDEGAGVVTCGGAALLLLVLLMLMHVRLFRRADSENS